MVHIFPGYPKESPQNPSITLLAFYLQLPKGFSDNVVNKDVLKAIVESNKSRIEEVVGGTIISIQPYIFTTYTETTEDSDEKPKSRNVIFLGASVGGVIMVVIFAILLLRFKRKKR